MSALEQRNKKQRAAPPQRDKRHAVEDTLDDDDAATPPALAVELRTNGYRVAAMRQPAPLVEAKRLRGAGRPPEPPPAFGEVRPYGTAEATALLSAIDKRVLPRALAPGLAGVVRLRIVDRRPGGGGPREVGCRVGDDEDDAAAPAPPRRIGAPLPRRCEEAGFPVLVGPFVKSRSDCAVVQWVARVTQPLLTSGALSSCSVPRYGSVLHVFLVSIAVP